MIIRNQLAYLSSLHSSALLLLKSLDSPALGGQPLLLYPEKKTDVPGFTTYGEELTSVRLKQLETFH